MHAGKLVFSQVMEFFRGVDSTHAFVGTVAIAKSKRFPAASSCESWPLLN